MRISQSILTKVLMLGRHLSCSRLSRSRAVIVVLTGFAALNTILAAMYLLSSALQRQDVLIPGSAVTLSGSSTPEPIFLLFVAVRFLSVHSLVLAPASWVLVGGVWVWRGRIRSRWEGLGFDSDVFRLFVKMRGGKTRLKLLTALLTPKDRYQLAKELNLDWRAVDQHLVILGRHGLISEENAYGRVKIYRLTQSGRSMLILLEDLEDMKPAENSHQQKPVMSEPSPRNHRSEQH